MPCRGIAVLKMPLHRLAYYQASNSFPIENQPVSDNRTYFWFFPLYLPVNVQSSGLIFVSLHFYIVNFRIKSEKTLRYK